MARDAPALAQALTCQESPMTSLQHRPSAQVAHVETTADTSWPSTRSQSDEARTNDDERLRRRDVAAAHRTGQQRHSAIIIGTVIAAGGLVWLLLTW
jgi:hypothetical protein